MAYTSTYGHMQANSQERKVRLIPNTFKFSLPIWMLFYLTVPLELCIVKEVGKNKNCMLTFHCEPLQEETYQNVRG